MKTELEIANERILELEEQVKKLTSNTVLVECSHFWHSNNASANGDWWCTRCGKVSKEPFKNVNLH